ncbi:MAG: hypothetical protein Q9214_001818, partial [Letrouitia sp. 1 TL-2023]
MKFIERFCETIVRALGLSSFTKWGKYSGNQQPLGGKMQVDGILTPQYPSGDSEEPQLPQGPKFKLPNSGITCDYSAMKGYKFVGGSQKGPVGSWLEPPNKKLPAFNIYTDYEAIAPEGVTRHITIDLINGTSTRHETNADGKIQFDSKLFNSSYPGPWIQACWGDTL